MHRKLGVTALLNISFLSTRYGRETLSDVVASGQQRCSDLGLTLETFQSNHEGAIVDRIHAARFNGTTGIIINAGAYTHTSVAIRDALSGVRIPFVEVHVSSTQLSRQATLILPYS
jgi:3-dehydroquinate dehydratase-2